jgi:hypothetical protein
MITAALVPFVLAIGATLFIATATYLGTTAALVLGLSTAAVAAVFWFGVERMQGRKRGLRGPGEQGDEKVLLSEKINALLTEARIVLPGVQALLGFQLAAYLTDAFAKLSATAKAVHTGTRDDPADYAGMFA